MLGAISSGFPRHKPRYRSVRSRVLSSEKAGELYHIFFEKSSKKEFFYIDRRGKVCDSRGMIMQETSRIQVGDIGEKVNVFNDLAQTGGGALPKLL